jgi:septum formation protein
MIVSFGESVKEIIELAHFCGAGHEPLPMTRPPLILASTSPYRRELLARLRLPFDVVSPGVDETPHPDERPADLCVRLAREKARVVAVRFPDAVVIGSDQVAVLGDAALSKPGNHANAVAQLRAMRGKEVAFLTAVAVARQGGERLASRLVPTDVRFRAFSDAAIEAYLGADAPYDCAGAAKIESLGIALVERVASADPTALVGLPLVALVDLLAEAGVAVLP